MNAQFIGVGVGPGDPELMTLKAARLIREADVISFLANGQGQSQALTIVQSLVSEHLINPQAQTLLPIVMPMNENRRLANTAYDEAAEVIEQAVNKDQKVIFLCEGDPLFFGSFAYLLERLHTRCSCGVVPGIASIHAASAALGNPLTVLKESFAVVSGRHTDTELEHALQHHDSVVIMKAGRARPKILSALKNVGRVKDAQYIEYIGRENEYIQRDVTQLEDEFGPYFSLFVVLRQSRGMLS